MKLKQNGVRFVFESAELNRVVAVFSLLINIDKRLNSAKRNAKKLATTKKQKSSSSWDSYDSAGSHKKRASDIFEKMTHNLEIAGHYDRYYHTHHSSSSFFHYQA